MAETQLLTISPLKVGAVFAFHAACSVGLSRINKKLRGITYPLACRQSCFILGCSVPQANRVMAISAVSLLFREIVNALIDRNYSEDKRAGAKRVADSFIYGATWGLFARILGCSGKVSAVVALIFSVSWFAEAAIQSRVCKKEIRSSTSLSTRWLLTHFKGAAVNFAVGRALRALMAR